MAKRATPLITNQIYHIFNKTIDKKQVFISNRYNSTFLDTLKYYRSTKNIVSYSAFKDLAQQLKSSQEAILSLQEYHLVDIYAYCVMPNHFHLLVKQKQEHGVSKYISNVLNSFTRYFNIKNERKGPLFLPRFKAVLVSSEEQFKHVSRYIHLNPYSSNLVEKISVLRTYPLSSLHEYSAKTPFICSTSYLLTYFNNSLSRYYRFLENNAEYQKTLEYCKHTAKW